MKYIYYVLTGIFFGIVLTKSEAISWFRIQEMFRFQSFHMYGIIGISVVLGIVLHLFLKKSNLKNIEGEEINFLTKPPHYKAAILGGGIFGLGWAMTGACPGPLYILLGHGYWIVLVVIVSAILGTLLYGILKEKLPH
jgi:uncharacterized membrane protein YedE/YeeE